MPWSSHTVRSHFQALVNQLTSFHAAFGKNKNSEEFGNIRLALEDGLDFLFAEKMPNGAGTVVSSFSTGIYQTLSQIGGKKVGKSDNAEFITDLMNVTRELVLFRNAAAVEIDAKERAKEREFGEEEREEQPTTTRALTHIDSKEVLAAKIRSLGVLPRQTNSWASLFKHAANYYPKTSGASVLSITFGLGYIALSTLDHYLGKTLDALIHADETGVNNKLVASGAIILAGITMGIVALAKSAPKKAKEEPEEVPEERERLIV